MKKLVTARKASQTFFLLLFMYILWSTTYPLKGLLPPETFFRTNPNIMIFTSISERLFLPGLYFALAMLVLTLIFGRFYCGWVCPLGTFIDCAGALKKRKMVLNDGQNKKVRKPKFVILGAVFLGALFGIQLAWVLDPMVIVARFVSLNLIPTATLVIDRFFIILIKTFNLYGPVYDAYRALKSSFLGVKVFYFANAGIIFLVFLLICSAALFISRSWCRTLCPLGALYSIAARFSLLRRINAGCTTCGKCVERCRMGVIKENADYMKGECILCMDCIYECPAQGTKFTFQASSKPLSTDTAEGKKGGISRKDFLFLMACSVFALGFRWRFGKSKEICGPVTRPPGALKEEDFMDRCIRCGNCMKVCPTNVLQPAILQCGLRGIWTPHLVNEIGYCEYNCTLCGDVCPTGAIPKLPLPKKQNTKLGIAGIDHSTCIAWAYNQKCLVCEEHCPVAEKAIKIEWERVDGELIGKPRVDPDLCIGCGICQNKCPVRPERAIKVSPKGADRT